MSWFDASGLASIAKSALKEAQKTIDKALDIKDSDVSGTPTNTPIDINDDFFGTWGLTQSGHVKDSKSEDAENVVTTSPNRGSKVSASLWGSFAGSFFEAPKEEAKCDSVESLDDSCDITNQNFKQSKLVVQHSEDGCSVPGEDVEDKQTAFQENLQPCTKKIEKVPSATNNRLSAVSNESKNSSESVEILSGETGCTTSPDSDAISLGLSTSSSAPALRQTSESVEVLPDSLTSPSSLEILGTDSPASVHTPSQCTDEFASPLQSPLVEKVSNTPGSKDSPDSIDVIPEEQDENSIAEDTSYTSVSETTSATVLEPFQPASLVPKHLSRHESLSECASNETSLSSDMNTGSTEAITRAPSRSSMHLPLTQLNTHLIDTQPVSTNQDIANLIKNPNVIDIPQDNESFNSSISEHDDGSHSDRTMIASDNVMESSSDTSTTTESNTNSSFLRNMLADAMTEKASEIPVETKSSHFMDLSVSMIDSGSNVDSLENISITQLEMPPRESSPISSESRSDLVKIGSGSGHTSGDEVETTTSSDIEIISSPNGDSSSTQSRQSPAKICVKNKTSDANIDILLGKMTFKKIKGHNRELSEASSISDDFHSFEVEQLIKRVSEVTEILELREAKLIEVSRRNAELQEMNHDLKRQLDSVLTKQLESADLSQVTEEYTQRLSALEKKFQQAIRDRDLLRKQTDQMKQEAVTRVSKGEVDSLLLEKDDIIKQLREEGEKLSKQQLQLSNIIKKLRAKEKEHESIIKNLKDKVEDLSSETERLKRSLTAKDEVERSQIEAIHQLTAKNKKFENEVSQLQSQLDDITQRYDTMKKSFEAAKKELVDKNRTSNELQAREQKLESLENEKRMTESQNEQMLNQMDDLRQRLREADQEYAKREQLLRNEISELLHRLESAEQRNEELSQSVLEVSKPLVRQLEALQATHNSKVASFEKTEQGLLIKINELQVRLQSAIDSERLSKEECIDLRRRLSALETQVASTNHELEMTKVELEKQKTEKIIAEQGFRRETDALRNQLLEEQEKVDHLDRELNALQQQLLLEKTANEAEKRRNNLLQEQMRERGEAASNVMARLSPPNTRNTSPTLSLGKTSLSESLGSVFWPPDEQFDVGVAPRYTNMFEMQMLQTNLKQREGEVQQLQWELNRREHERTLLNAEISTLLSRVENLEAKLEDHESLTVQFNEVQQQYDTLCQLYGEKVEENEELKLDLQDVKEMYKMQIDDLLKQQKEKS